MNLYSFFKLLAALTSAIFLALAGLFFHLGNTELARAIYSTLSSVNLIPTATNTFNQGATHYRQQNYDLAIHSWLETVQQAPEIDDLNLLESAYYNLGDAYYRQGEAVLKSNVDQTVRSWKQAIDVLEKALKINPNDIRAVENLEFIKSKLAEIETEASKTNQEQQDQGNQASPQPNQYSGETRIQDKLNQGDINRIKETDRQSTQDANQERQSNKLYEDSGNGDTLW